MGTFSDLFVVSKFLQKRVGDGAVYQGREQLSSSVYVIERLFHGTFTARFTDQRADLTSS